jgi:hypothetical protein
MREFGIPKLTTWRWAPCAALVLGSVSFAAFAMLVIPERIGGASVDGSQASRLGAHFAASQLSPPARDWSDGSSTSTNIDSARPTNPTRVATHGSEVFPKRGFTPPLDRPPAQAAAPQEPPPLPTLVPPPAPPAPAEPVPAPEAAPPLAQQAPAAQPEAELPPPGSSPAPNQPSPQND